MKLIFLLLTFLFLTTNIFSEKNYILFRGGDFINGKLINSHDSEAQVRQNRISEFNLLTDRNNLVNVPLDDQIKTQNIKNQNRPRIFELEIGYKNFRFTWEKRDFDLENYSNNQVVLKNFAVNNFFSRNVASYSESRDKLSLAYLIPLGKLLNIGIQLNYFQIFSFSRRYTSSYFTEINQFTRSGISEIYAGYTPSILAELKIKPELLFGFNLNFVNLDSKKNESYVSSRTSFMIYNADNYLRGNIYKLYLIYRPLTWLGFNFNYTKEDLFKKYNDYSFITTIPYNTPNYAYFNLLERAIIQSEKYPHVLSFFSFQVEFIKEL